MKPINNFDTVETPREYKRLVPGGYICRITRVEDHPDKEYLKIEYDIADGMYKNYWSDTAERNGWWGGDFVKSYREGSKAIGFFKQFIKAVEDSNSGYTFRWDEQTLVGKLVGLVLGEEEYNKRTGGVGIRLSVRKTVSVATIREGGYSVPQKLAAAVETPVSSSVSDDDLPFDFD